MGSDSSEGMFASSIKSDTKRSEHPWVSAKTAVVNARLRLLTGITEAVHLVCTRTNGLRYRGRHITHGARTSRAEATVESDGT